MSIASSSKTTKPKMSNSFKLLTTGPTVAEIQKEYEILSDIVIEYNGKVHGSPSHIFSNNNSIISLIVYYEVPKGQLVEAVKQKFDNFTKNAVIILNRNWWIESEVFHYFSSHDGKTRKTLTLQFYIYDTIWSNLMKRNT